MWWGIVSCKWCPTLILWVYLRIYLMYIISESGAETSQINKYKRYHKTTVFWPREVCHLCCHLLLCYSLPATYFSSPPGSTQQLRRNSEGSYQCRMRPGHLRQCECGSFHIYICKQWWFQWFRKRFLNSLIDNCSLQRLQTALHIAAEHGRQNIAEMILISGVNLNLLDKVQFPVITLGCGQYLSYLNTILIKQLNKRWKVQFPVTILGCGQYIFIL